MVVSQQFCTAVRSLRFAEVCRPHGWKASMSEIACSQQLSRCNIPRVKASVEGVCLIEGGF
jgi:hypothetical protein